MDWGVVPNINAIVASILVLAEITDCVFVPTIVYLNLHLVSDIQTFEIVFPDESVTCGYLYSECHTLLR